VTPTLRTCKALLPYWPVISALASLIVLPWYPLVALAVGLFSWYYTFSGAVGLVQTIGRVYFILKRDTRLVSLGRGTMHELSSPWRKGSGLYVTLLKWSFQIGICYPQQLSDEQGTLSAVQGRYLETTPKEIGQW
jgi:hypothetical protein